MYGLPWWSSGQASTLPVHRAWVCYLVGELGSNKLRRMVRKKKKTHLHKVSQVRE